MSSTTVTRDELGLMAPVDVAELVGVTQHTLSIWRARRTGPRFVRLGRTIYYRRSDVIAWIENCIVETTETPLDDIAVQGTA